MGAEYHRCIIRNIVQFLDKYRAQTSQAVYHKPVMNNLVANVNRCTEQLQGTLDDIDRAVDPGTESARIGEQDTHRGEG